MMIKKKNDIEYELFIILLLLFQGITAVVSTSLTGMMALLIMALSAYYCFIANSKYLLPRALKLLSSLIVIFIIYGSVLILSGKGLIVKETGDPMPSRKYLVDLMLSLLPIFPFYIFTKRGFITEKTMQRLFFVFFAIAVVSYIKARTIGLERALETNQYATDVTNNSGYVILSLLPFLVFLDRRPLVRYTMLALITILVLYAIKRGAILILALCLMFYLPLVLKKSAKLVRVVTIIVIGVVGVYAYNYILDFVESNTYFATRLELMQEGDLQARSGIWTGILLAFLDANPFQMLFGRGAWATLEVSTNLAHNDWLEILTNQGLVGIYIFASFWYTFFQAWRKSKKNTTLYTLLGLLFITHFTRTFFSMSISAMPIYATCLIGYAFACYSNMLQTERTIKIGETVNEQQTHAHVGIAQ